MNYNKLFLLILFLPLISFAQTDSTDIIVQKIMNQQKIVGLSLAVIKNGTAVVNKGYGLANAELNVAATSETVFRLGSVSKQFFSAAIMKLQEDGKLSIEDNVHKYFPDAPETWRPIKIKHLLSHTSGLQREAPAYDNNKVQPDMIVIRSAYSLPLDYKTGEKYQYCNLGYFMLAEIVSQVSGKPWHEYIRKQFFIPAGMNNTSLTEYQTIVPNRASGYMHKNDTLLNTVMMVGIRPSGGFLSTSSDMIKWDKVLREEKIILKKENWEKLWQPFVATSGKPGSKSFYGFGWMIDELNGHRSIAHSGSNIGFKSYYSRFPDDGLAIIVLTNEDAANPSILVNELAAYYFRK